MRGRVRNLPHRFPILQHADIWYIPAIRGAPAMLVVTIEIATMARSMCQ